MEKEAVRILEAAQMYDVKVAIEKVGGAAGAEILRRWPLIWKSRRKKQGFSPGW
ncbi:MAG: hypothetical protein ACFNWY_00955 [Negativicutes bacterium]